MAIILSMILKVTREERFSGFFYWNIFIFIIVPEILLVMLPSLKCQGILIIAPYSLMNFKGLYFLDLFT